MGRRSSYLASKRLFDVVVSSFALLMLSPLLAAVWLAVRLDSAGPAIYRGSRVGRDGNSFQILKFRSMRVGLAGTLTTALNDPRVTRVGRVIRRTKLDELPQLWNVVRGDMSVVGPRPEFSKWVSLYSEDQMRILSVRPGLTDYASVAYVDLDRYVGSSDPDRAYLETTFGEKNRLRLQYVDDMSWKVDICLIVGTIKGVVVSASGRARSGS